MKKVLFATTALIATGSVAAADVTFGGWGRFGIVYNSNASGVDSTTELTHRFRLQIDATAESDNGVTFGARTRMQLDSTATGGGDTAVMGAARFFARSGGFEVGVGNIFGALDSMPGMYPIDLGLTGLGYNYTPITGFDGFDTTGVGRTNGIEVMYSAGDFQAHVSYSEANAGDPANDRLAAHVAYTWNGWQFALGGQDSDNAAATELAASVTGSFGIADVSLAYADNGTAGDAWSLTARFDVGAATNVEVYVADADAFAETSYGVDFNHDMGGGTSLRGGIAKLGNDTTRADLGVRFNF